MRQQRTVQANLFDLFAGHEIGRELNTMSQWLDEHRDLLGLVARDLSRCAVKATGRQGLPAEAVLRCALLKQYRQLSYQELAFHLEDSASFRAFARLPWSWSPQKSVLQKTISAIRSETWEEINRTLLANARQAKLEDGRATMFLADMKNSGITVERALDSLDTCFPGGHGVVRFENLRVPASDILGETGQGFRYAQVRLSPARLTHCMRWLGAARRAHDVAVDYARERHAFGKKIGEHEGIGFMLADNEMDLHTARLSIWHCAWLLDQGQGLGRHASSVAKVISSEAIWRVVDRCVQILGGQGVTHEKIVARIFADVRSFRIYDGPSEVHRWSIARHILSSNTH